MIILNILIQIRKTTIIKAMAIVIITMTIKKILIMGTNLMVIKAVTIIKCRLNKNINSQ
jgi:hypothetical protein